MEINGNQGALVAPCLARAQPIKFLGQCKWQGHIWSTKAPESTPASPVLTLLHPTRRTRATPASLGTLLQASTWGHEPRITHEPQDVLCSWAERAEGRRNLLPQGKQRFLTNE